MEWDKPNVVSEDKNAINYEKTYGVRECNGRYRIVLDIKEDGRGGYYSNSTDLSYKRKDRALREAEAFCRSLYKPFIDFQGRRVTFQFKNMGEI